MEVGKSIPRIDAADKVTGRAMFTDDFMPRPALVAKILHSTIAHGAVKSIDTTAAAALPGVFKVVTCFDVPQHTYPTPGHPWSTEPSHQDTADRWLLTRRVRYYGDDIAAVIAEDAVTAEQALRLLRVEYDPYPVYQTPDEALAPGATPIHDNCPGNLLKAHTYDIGDPDAVLSDPNYRHFSLEATTQQVQHCHLENPVSYAYREGGRVVVVSSTQIPHIVRRVIAQALAVPFGDIRVVKPYIGGGFGNKQEVLYEPLNAFLCLQAGGRTVLLDITREETFENTRSRHAIAFRLRAAVDATGRLMARECVAVSNQGGYASHGHAIVANTVSGFRQCYPDALAHRSIAKTVYTNRPAAGAMRGYGIPQAVFASECLMEDIARDMNLDPIAFRLKNIMPVGYADPSTGITCHTTGLAECVEKGRTLIDWDSKRKAYQNQSGPLRRGVGMALFSYKTGVYPISLETSSARMVLNQDGTVQLHLGATEIGQGGDTVFCQMAADAVGIPIGHVSIVSTQDTDVAPFDTGAYASRQTYVTGKAIQKCGLLLRRRILEYAAQLTARNPDDLTLQGTHIFAGDDAVISLADAAMEAFYSLSDSRHLTAEVTHHCQDNTYAFGACFAEVEVDIPVGKVRVVKLVNVHDSGKLINPKLAEAQVHGGMSMGIGYALLEEMKYDDKGRLLNGNLLDYKMPTAVDHPELVAAFVETDDPTGPFGNKALGEPPTIPVAGALRNAILHATGVAVYALPMNAQRLTEAFTRAGLIAAKGGA